MIKSNKILALLFISIGVVATAKGNEPAKIDAQDIAAMAASDREKIELPRRQPISVRDIIELKRAVDPSAYQPLQALQSTESIASFSPDGTKFVVVTSHGDLRERVNVSTLLVFRSADAVRGDPTPLIDITFKSSSNRPAIHSVRWRRGGRAISFIGEAPGEPAQVIRLEIASGTSETLTSSKTSVISYSLNDAADRIAYIAEAEWQSLWDDEATRRSGLVISNQRLVDLMIGRSGYRLRGPTAEFDLFVQNGREVRRIVLSQPVARGYQEPALSPDAKHVVVRVQLHPAEVPDTWRMYRLPGGRHSMATTARRGQAEASYDFQVYKFVDFETGESRQLLNAPVSAGSAAPLWIRDGKAIVLRSYLPLGSTLEPAKNDSPAEAQLIELEVGTGKITTIGAGCARPMSWSSAESLLQCEPELKKGEKDRGDLFLKRGEGAWIESARRAVELSRPRVYVSEDFATPPKIVAASRASGRERTLVDLNPGIGRLALGKVQNLAWPGPNGTELHVGLYYPVDFEPGRRYPLVIQTHGWDPSRFRLDGYPAPGYAAQALAAQGFFVAQLNEVRYDLFLSDQRQEVDAAIQAYRLAIEELVRRGYVDRARVGVVGWSRTCFFVKYAMAHTSLFAAASIAEGEDGGYLQYITRNNYYVDPDDMYGGAPFGANLQRWLKESPGFNLTQVRTPLRITVLNPRLLLGDWEWFSGLSELHKPVEMLMLQDGDHYLQKPLERAAAGEANVDWFRFWLQGYEDPRPVKAEQYRRWRELRSMQQ